MKNLIYLLIICVIFSCKKKDCIPSGVCNDDSFVFGTKCYVDSICTGFGGTKFFNDCDLDNGRKIVLNKGC